MKVFIIGLPESGRTTVAKALSHNLKYYYVDAASWIKCTFRDPNPGETVIQYQEAYHAYLINRLTIEPNLVTNNVQDILEISKQNSWSIDGVFSPRDFSVLFDYNTDVVVFLNRIDKEPDCPDYQKVGISVMRDYCFWLASAGLLQKNRWVEYNFRIPGEDSDIVKTLGSKNSVYIVKSIEKVIRHLSEHLQTLITPR